MNQQQFSQKTWLSLLLSRLIWGILLVIPAGFLVMFLWNHIVTKAFNGANPLNFLESIGLLVLCRILFYSGWFAPNGPDTPKKSKRSMPEEDRAAFLARVRDRLQQADIRSGGNWSSGNQE